MKTQNRQAGSGLIQAMIAASLMGLVGVGYVNMQQKFHQSFE